jgi:hypothetical protein
MGPLRGHPVRGRPRGRGALRLPPPAVVLGLRGRGPHVGGPARRRPPRARGRGLPVPVDGRAAPGDPRVDGRHSGLFHPAP